MKGLILIDGPDAAGKSTLAQFLKDRYGARVIHLTYRFKDKMFTYQTAALRLALRLAEKQLVVIDRHWPSECVYGSVFRGGSKWGQAGRFYDRILLKHAALHVLALPLSVDEAIAAHRANLDDDHPYDDTDFRKVVQRYLHFGYGYSGVDDMAAAPRIPDYAHDFATCGGVFKERPDWVEYRLAVEGKDLGQFCQTLLLRLRRWREAQIPAALRFDRANWGGHAGIAKWIVIGDSTDASTRQSPWPLYDFTAANTFLNDALAAIGVMEHDLLWFNCDANTVIPFAGWERISHLPAICLGEQARAFANSLGFSKITKVTHPVEASDDSHIERVPFHLQLIKGIKQ